MAFKDSSCETDKQNLEYTDHDPDNCKVDILCNVSENIEFIIDLSAANHVEDLEPNEKVENSGQVSRLGYTQHFLVISRQSI